MDFSVEDSQLFRLKMKVLVRNCIGEPRKSFHFDNELASS